MDTKNVLPIKNPLHSSEEEKASHEKKKKKKKNYYIIIMASFLIASISFNIALVKVFLDEKNHMPTNNALIKTAQAESIYNTFTCPCCGKPIDEDCCGMARDRKEYADSLMQTDKPEEEIILEYTKKYGLDSFADKNQAKEFREKLLAQAPPERPIIAVSPETRDLGEISQKNGIAKTAFEIKNEGKEDLIINKLETSCGCTSASVIYKGEEGPVFTMPGHGKENPTDWEVTIKPQEKAELKVYYDPNAHKDLQGSVIRDVYISSNDSIDSEKKVSIELNQVH